jgi:hypothetical protein
LIQYLAGLVVNIPKDGGLGLRTQLVEGWQWNTRYQKSETDQENNEGEFENYFGH